MRPLENLRAILVEASDESLRGDLRLSLAHRVQSESIVKMEQRVRIHCTACWRKTDLH
jgi:hypothetical protein